MSSNIPSFTSPRFTAFNAAGEPTEIGTDDHVITRDALTGLEYTSAGERHDNHDAAIAACSAVDIAGGGWRAPTRAELFAIADVTRMEPAVDPEAFPFVQPRWYWSSDLTAWSSSAAWGVYFYHGFVYYYHRDYLGFALAVRSVRRPGQ